MDTVVKSARETTKESDAKTEKNPYQEVLLANNAYPYPFNQINGQIFVDMDRQQEGYLSQYSQQNADNTETTIHMLLPLLKFEYPNANIEGNFTLDTEEKYLHTTWDYERQMIVNTTCDVETAQFQEDETLFFFAKLNPNPNVSSLST